MFPFYLQALVSMVAALGSSTILPGDPRHQAESHHHHHHHNDQVASESRQITPLAYISSQTPYALSPNGATSSDTRSVSFTIMLLPFKGYLILNNSSTHLFYVNITLNS